MIGGRSPQLIFIAQQIFYPSRSAQGFSNSLRNILAVSTKTVYITILYQSHGHPKNKDVLNLFLSGSEPRQHST
jgi:hypothetical protein